MIALSSHFSMLASSRLDVEQRTAAFLQLIAIQLGSQSIDTSPMHVLRPPFQASVCDITAICRYPTAAKHHRE